MGLFDKRDTKKKKDDFDSPVEKIDLSAPDPVEMEAEPPPANEPANLPASAASEPAPAAAADDDDADFDSSFGIDKAIELMRTLPSDNVELVVQVVKLTLESTKVKVRSIINDATRKQEDIQGRIKVLKDEIAEYEREISTRKEEIKGLEADYEETTTVKDRLQLAEKITRPGGGGSASGGGGAQATTKKVSSEGRDTAKAAGTIGTPGSSRPMGSPGPGKSSVVIKK